MSPVFSLTEGETALLVSIPHDGRALAPGQAERMSAAGLALPDTDWHVRRLYAFAVELGATVIAANFSRYVVDLNRPADNAALYAGQVSTGLCPATTFAGDPIYQPGREDTEAEQAARVESYWRPYHEGLRRTVSHIRDTHGHVVLWDAHSIPSRVPRLFDGELPDLNLGTNEGRSCHPAIEAAVAAVARNASYSTAVNGRFKGGYITRHYGNPDQGVHAIQLELAQQCYMDESSSEYDDARAGALAELVQEMLDAALRSAAKR